MENLKIGFIPLARPTFDIDLANHETMIAREQLLEAGFELIGPKELVTDLAKAQSIAFALEIEDLDQLLIFQSTFADSTMVTALAEKISAPIFLWAVPEDRSGDRLRLNSLCGINLAAHALTRRAINYDYEYARPGDKEVLCKVYASATAGNIRRRLKAARLGVVGEHPPGMDSCHLDAPLLEEKLGVQIIKIPLDKVFSEARVANLNTLKQIHTALLKQLPNLNELEQGPLFGTLSVYTALGQIVREQNLDGLAVRCWPEFFTELGCAACGAMSMLSDGYCSNKPIPCCCEADINGTITQLILQWLSGTPAFGSDLVSMDFKEDNAVFWHCGLAPYSMADPNSTPRGGNHSNRQVPLVMEFPLKPGEITLARISQATGDLRLALGQANMLPGSPSFSGTSGILRFQRPARDVFHTILGKGLEHHFSMVYGNHVPELEALARVLDLPIVTL